MINNSLTKGFSVAGFMKIYVIFLFQVGVESRATQSVRVPVQNLQKYDPHINVNQLQVMR